MTERQHDELDDESSAVLGDLFDAALTTPDPGSTVDLASILAAARAEAATTDQASPEEAAERDTPEPTAAAGDTPPGRDELGRRRRLRVFQTLGGVAAAAALVFGVTQLPLGSGTDSAGSVAEQPARALDQDAGADTPAPATAESYAAEAPAPASGLAAESAEGESDTFSAADGGAAPTDSAAGSASQEASAAPNAAPDPGAGGSATDPSSAVQTGAGACAQPAAAVLSAVVEVDPQLSVVPISAAHGAGCAADFGFRVIAATSAFDVLIGGPPSADAVAAAGAGPALVQVVPLPGADARDLDPDLVAAVVAAVGAALD